MTKAVEANEAKVIAAENNYVMLSRRHTDLENENKDLRKSISQTQDRISQLEGALAQQRRGFEDAESRNNRRMLDSEGELKELSRRIGRVNSGIRGRHKLFVWAIFLFLKSGIDSVNHADSRISKFWLSAHVFAHVKVET